MSKIPPTGTGLPSVSKRSRSGQSLLRRLLLTGIQVLDTIQTSFPRALTPHLKELLSSALSYLSLLFPTFTHYYLKSGASVPRSSEDETIELTHLVCPMLDFVASVARSGKAKDWFQGDNLSGLIGAVFGWVQMSNDDETEWGDNANAFVAQESDDTLSYSVRMAGFDLLSVGDPSFLI